jgi:cell division protein FtsI (penicillin-binding protein 3)
MNKRAIILSTAIFFGFVTVVFRLADLMLLNHERLAERARDQYVGNRSIQANRGGIYDRRGREWAVNVDVQSAYFNPVEAEVSAEEAARSLSKVAGAGRKTLIGRFSSGKSFVWIGRKLSSGQVNELKSLGLKGLGFLPEVMRLYPKGRLGSHIVGFVGIDNQPLGGIELRYDENLRGRAERVAYSRDAAGRELSGGLDLKRRVNSVVLTIDEGLQYILEKELDSAMEEWRPVSVSAIMMNPFTGEILAMANRPTFDPNSPSAYVPSVRRNRAITDTYEPGSTFKLVAASAALEEKAVDNSMEFDCSNGYIRVGKKAIWDTHRNGVLKFKEVIQTSSNVGTIMIAQLLGEEKLYKYIKRFGFGERTGIDLPGESGGLVRPFVKWSNYSLASMSIGYGVGVTPLQVLRAYSAVANGGLLVKPHVVREIISPEGDTVYRFNSGYLERAISKNTADTLKDILVSVTNEGGTAFGASVDGNLVAGKTGTVRLIDPETGKYSTERYASSFVGFVPADRPKMAIIVVVHEPQGEIYGGRVAAPVFKRVADKTLTYLNVPREDTFKENILVVQGKKDIS